MVAAGFDEACVEACDESGVDLADVELFEVSLAEGRLEANMDLAGFAGAALGGGGCF